MCFLLKKKLVFIKLALGLYFGGGKPIEWKNPWKIIIKDGIFVFLAPVEYQLVPEYWNFLEIFIF